MLKKEVKFTNFDDEEVIETCYFHLSEVEIVEMQAKYKGGMKGMVQSIIDAKDAATAVAIFKDMILDSYGRRSADGNSFEKTLELRHAFSQSIAFSTLFVEIAEQADVKMVEFMAGIFPKKYADELRKEIVAPTVKPSS